jgi:hypothetical protein
MNSIVFSGENLSAIRIVIDEMNEKKAQGIGWIPRDYTSDNFYHYMFDIDATDNHYDIVLNCWTKWTPPIDEILFLCSRIGVDFTMFYEELGMNVYGRCSFDSETNTFEDVHLTDEDFKRVVEDEDTFDFTFDGEPIECRYDAYELMLENKQTI